jgi:hypothetical protein
MLKNEISRKNKILDLVRLKTNRVRSRLETKSRLDKRIDLS